MAKRSLDNQADFFGKVCPDFLNADKTIVVSYSQSRSSLRRYFRPKYAAIIYVGESHIKELP